MAEGPEQARRHGGTGGRTGVTDPPPPGSDRARRSDRGRSDDTGDEEVPWKRRYTERRCRCSSSRSQAGEAVVSEAGEFSWMSDAMTMDTNTGGGMAGKGIMGAVERAVVRRLDHDDDLHRTRMGPGHRLRLEGAGPHPAHRRGPGNEFMVHRHGFMAGTPGIELSMGFQQSFRGGIFGGEGFILQKIGGTGRAFVDLSGEVIVYDLRPGRRCGYTRAMPGSSRPLSPSRCRRSPGLANRYMGPTVTTSPC